MTTTDTDLELRARILEHARQRLDTALIDVETGSLYITDHNGVVRGVTVRIETRSSGGQYEIIDEVPEPGHQWGPVYNTAEEAVAALGGGHEERAVIVKKDG